MITTRLERPPEIPWQCLNKDAASHVYLLPGRLHI